MTKHEIELLVRMRSEAEAALNKTAEGLKAVASEATKAGAGMDKVTKASTDATAATTTAATKTKELADQSANLSERVTTVAGRFGVSTTALVGMTTAAGAATAVVGTLIGTFVKGFEHTWKLGASFQDLAQSSGASVEGLQRLRFGAATTGTDLQKLLGAAKDLSERLGDGDAGAAGAMRKLGVSIADFQRMGADQQVLTLNTALQKVTNETQRAQVQAGLFGNEWRTIAPAMAADLSALGDKAERLGIVMGTSTVESIRKMDNAIATLEVAGEGMLARFMEPFIDSLGRLNDAMPDTNVSLGDLAGALGRVVLSGHDVYNPMSLLIGLLNEQADAASDAAQEWDKLGRSMGRTHANDGPSGTDRLALARVMTEGLTKAQRDNIEAQLRLGDSVDKVAQSMGLSKDVVKLYQEQLREASRRSRELTETLLDQRGYDAHVAKLRAETKALYDLAVMAASAAQGLQSVAASRGVAIQVATQALGGRDLGGLTNAVSGGGFVGASNQNTIAGRSGGLGFNWGGILQQGAGIVMSGGNVGGGLGSMAGGIGGSLLSSGLGFAAGSTMGSVIPVLGTIIGGFIGKQLGGLFGPSKSAIADRQATSNIQGTQAGLLDRYGSVEAIAGMTRQGQELAAGWGHQGRAGEAAFNAQVKAFEDSLRRQSDLKSELITKERDLASLEADRAALVESLVPKWQSVKSILDEYGISLEGAGLKVQQLAATDDWTTMINKIQTLERAGVDSGHMINGMADEISKAVQQALKFGTDVPANMRHYIDALMAAGLLVDENGEKITDLSNLKWGDKIATEADKTNERIDAMTDAIDEFKKGIDEIVKALRELLPAAAGDAARGVQDEWDRNRPRLGYDVEGNRGSGEPTSTVDVPGAANGVLAGGPRGAKFRIFGEREPELGGSVDFMSRVLSKAMDLTGGMAGGFRLENVIVIDGKVAARSLSGPLVRNLHARKLIR